MKRFLKLLAVERVVPNALLKVYAAAPPKLTSCSENAIHLKLSMLVAVAFVVSCESTNYVPPVTSQMTAAKTGQHVDLATLREGRTLFVHRCIECHTLPSLWHYRKEDWPEIVNSMSQRASLNPAERDAIVSYIRAIRAQH